MGYRSHPQNCRARMWEQPAEGRRVEAGHYRGLLREKEKGGTTRIPAAFNFEQSAYTPRSEYAHSSFQERRCVLFANAPDCVWLALPFPFVLRVVVAGQTVACGHSRLPGLVPLFPRVRSCFCADGRVGGRSARHGGGRGTAATALLTSVPRRPPALGPRARVKARSFARSRRDVLRVYVCACSTISRGISARSVASA